MKVLKPLNVFQIIKLISTGQKNPVYPLPHAQWKKIQLQMEHNSELHWYSSSRLHNRQVFNLEASFTTVLLCSTTNKNLWPAQYLFKMVLYLATLTISIHNTGQRHIFKTKQLRLTKNSSKAGFRAQWRRTDGELIFHNQCQLHWWQGLSDH